MINLVFQEIEKFNPRPDKKQLNDEKEALLREFETIQAEQYFRQNHVQYHTAMILLNLEDPEYYQKLMRNDSQAAMTYAHTNIS